MTHDTSTTPALRVFIGLYIAPACGQWVTVTEDTDPSELHAIGKKIAAKHNAEEYAIFDTDGELGRVIGENTPFDTVCTLAKVASELGEGSLTAFRLWLNNTYEALETPDGPDADALIDSFREEYAGAFDNLKDWAEQQIGDCYSEMLEGMGNMAQYFDYESFAHDEECGGCIWTARADGQLHVFTN